MSEHTEEELTEGILAAHRAGKIMEAEQLSRSLKKLQATAPVSAIEKKTQQAMSRVTADPLAGFRGMFGGEERDPTQAVAPSFTQPSPGSDVPPFDPWKGVVFLGRGVDNIVKGYQQMSIDSKEYVGNLGKEQAGRMREDIYAKRREEDSAYGPLKERYPVASMMGEFVGETAPFVMTPVPELTAGVTAVTKTVPMFLRGMSRMAPESVAAGAEAALPYVPEGESRMDRAVAGAVMGGAAKVGTDYFAKRANVRRERMKDSEIQEMHDLGKEFDVLVRKPGPRGAGQLDTAERAAEIRMGPDKEAGRMAEDFVSGVNRRGEDISRQYEDLFDDVDAIGWDKAAGRQSEFSAVTGDSLDVSTLRNSIKDLLQTEMDKLGHANPTMVAEYRRWIETPDPTSLRGLHEFRSGLRRRARGMPAEAGVSSKQMQDLEDTISRQMHKMAELRNPGAGDALERIDNWYYNDVAKFNRIPALKQMFGADPSPSKVQSWLMGGKPSDVNAMKKQVWDNLTPDGKEAIIDSIWNDAYNKATRGVFKPRQYANSLDTKIGHIRELEGAGSPNVVEMENLSKLMKHIDGEGKATEFALLKMIRGYPFVYRAVTDQLRMSNFRYMLREASPDIRPGNKAMENFYRGIIRSFAADNEERVSDVGKMASDVFTGGYEMVKETAGSMYDKVMP